MTNYPIWSGINQVYMYSWVKLLLVSIFTLNIVTVWTDKYTAILSKDLKPQYSKYMVENSFISPDIYPIDKQWIYLAQ